jgi:hypothetical protein
MESTGPAIEDGPRVTLGSEIPRWTSVDTDRVPVVVDAT